ncbi:MAG: cbb3-type cytochrome oxidase assembly protein CcoS [Candidatus Sphingomonas colombiensis]|nr:cbb3-type cytochrome oxidase assembly protein CcoS [Sphingomonas sp.]WEK43143.1 MAG: cbb3-type cytochrome oxidase assembly protein CcoS [Sphingomonas sp.]
MNSVGILIPIALLLGLSGLGGFFWAVRSGQYDDMDGAAMRILNEEKPEAASIDRDNSVDG